MAQALGRMARALGMCGQTLNLLGGRGAHDLELDINPLEVRGRVIDVVLLGIAEGRTHIGAGVINRYAVEWREPRHLSQ